MNDQELLIYAAKAINLKWLSYHHSKGLCCRDDKYGGLIEYYWNPLENDADAFQLMVTLSKRDGGVALMLNSRFNSTNFAQCYTDGETIVPMEWMQDDPYAATRRAIVGVAAEIGKGM